MSRVSVTGIPPTQSGGHEARSANHCPAQREAQWIEALRPYAAGFMAEGPDESSRMAEEFDEDDSD